MKDNSPPPAKPPTHLIIQLIQGKHLTNTQ